MSSKCIDAESCHRFLNRVSSIGSQGEHQGRTRQDHILQDLGNCLDEGRNLTTWRALLHFTRLSHGEHVLLLFVQIRLETMMRVAA